MTLNISLLYLPSLYPPSSLPSMPPSFPFFCPSPLPIPLCSLRPPPLPLSLPPFHICQQTIGAAFGAKKVSVSGESVTLGIWVSIDWFVDFLNCSK